MIRRLAGRDLRRLSQGLEEAFPVASPRPSAELLALLDPELLEPGAVTGSPGRRTDVRRRVAAWLVGLGATGQAVLGTSVALAASVGAGVAGVLPDPLQQVFDRATVLLSPDDIVDDSPEPRIDQSVEEDPSSVSRPVTPPRESADDRARRPDGSKPASSDDPEPPGNGDGSQGSTTSTPPQTAPPPATAPPPGNGSQGSGGRDEREDREDQAQDAAEDAQDDAEDAADDTQDAADEAADEAAESATKDDE